MRRFMGARPGWPTVAQAGREMLEKELVERSVEQ